MFDPKLLEIVDDLVEPLRALARAQGKDDNRESIRILLAYRLRVFVRISVRSKPKPEAPTAPVRVSNIGTLARGFYLDGIAFETIWTRNAVPFRAPRFGRYDPHTGILKLWADGVITSTPLTESIDDPKATKLVAAVQRFSLMRGSFVARREILEKIPRSEQARKKKGTVLRIVQAPSGLDVSVAGRLAEVHQGGFRVSIETLLPALRAFEDCGTWFFDFVEIDNAHVLVASDRRRYAACFVEPWPEFEPEALAMPWFRDILAQFKRDQFPETRPSDDEPICGDPMATVLRLAGRKQDDDEQPPKETSGALGVPLTEEPSNM